MRKLVFILFVTGFLGGCQFVFDEDSPDITLVGGPPNMDNLPRLNRASAEQAQMMWGYHADGRWGARWVAFQEPQTLPTGVRKNGVRAVRLDEPVAEEVIPTDDVTIGIFEFYLLEKEPVPDAGMPDPERGMRLTIHSPGQTRRDEIHVLPAGPGFVYIGGAARAFFYWVLDPDSTSFLTVNRDNGFRRTLELPTGESSLSPFENADYQWNDEDKLLIVRDKNGDVVAHSTEEDTDLAVGGVSKLWWAFAPRKIISCGDDGLRLLSIVPLAGSGEPPVPERMLDATPCNRHGNLIIDDKFVYYSVGGELRRVLLDGSAMPERVLEDGQRVLLIADTGIIFSRDPEDRYVNAVGDGWLGSWRFMERGYHVGFSRDKSKLRWLDFAARPNGAGELRSAKIGQLPLRLTSNTRIFEELADGRVLADANHAFRGTQNRVVVIDEEAREARWVASAASDYFRFSEDEIIVDVVTGPTGYDIVRVKIPPPVRAADAGTD